VPGQETPIEVNGAQKGGVVVEKALRQYHDKIAANLQVAKEWSRGLQRFKKRWQRGLELVFVFVFFVVLAPIRDNPAQRDVGEPICLR